MRVLEECDLPFNSKHEGGESWLTWAVVQYLAVPFVTRDVKLSNESLGDDKTAQHNRKVNLVN